MGCYCFNQIVTKVDYKTLDLKFTEINPEDDTKYCNLWATAYATHLAVKYGAPGFIALINIIVSSVFKYMGALGLYFTKTEETSSTFYSLTFLQFINIGVILLV